MKWRTIVSLAVLGLLVWAVYLLPFRAILLSLYLVGFAGALLFCLTWYPLAFRALYHHADNVSVARIFDYAGVQAAIVLAYGFILRNFATSGIQPLEDPLSLVGRVLLPLTVDAIIFLRLYKWGRQLWIHRAVPGPPDPLRGVSQHDHV